MSDGLFIERNGFRTMLKWHRGHQQAGDISFTPERIAQGMALGASVEVDILCHADGGFVVLHDAHLDNATTGQGPVAQASAASLQSLCLRDATGAPTHHRVMLLEQLGHLLATTLCGAGAVLQLDLKEPATRLGAREIAAFKAAVQPVAQHLILSGGDAQAVTLLANAVQGLPVGYDPCHDDARQRLLTSRDFTGFVDHAVSAIDKTEMIYLDHHLLLSADELGFDLVAAFHAHDKRVDAYTIKNANAAVQPAVNRLLALRCDQITTDDPAGLEALMRV
ncbi:glycerophosphoryl diester phosphodiesterase [Agrobacterium vitis]|nr:glycerophosphoryl diester phosphodiesterase [Agrobacterium vitis]MBE1438299.1 glycerophosphoryl diester phosphodiesterase [Agrobacterium vitis]